MGSFGERMQREREMRGITLEEIAESTKIGTRSLRALEGEDFDKLPGGIFNKGFVRAYAKYLGIDEEQAVTDFMAAYGDYQQQQPQAPEASKPDEEAPPASLNLLAVGGAVVVLVLFLAIWGFHDRLSGTASRIVHRFRRAPAAQAPNTVAASPTPAVPTAPVSQPAPAAASGTTVPADPAAVPAGQPSGDTASAAAPGPAKTAPEMALAGREFVLQVHARQDAWVKIKADDELLMEGVLKGDKTIHAKQKVVFTTGNAAAIELSFNGEAQPSLGADNQVKTVVFTPDGRVR